VTLRPSDTSTSLRGADEGGAPDADDRAAADAPTGDAGRGSGDRKGIGRSPTPPTDPGRPSGDPKTAPAEGRSRAPGSDRFLLAVAVDGEVLFAGPSVPDVVGVERDALVGSELLNRVHPTDREPAADGDWVWLESRTRKARERRLTDRNERLDRFASIVSHDLRNPLSVIRGSIEMARLRGETEPLERGERAVERIDQLVSELLTLARQGTGMDEPTEFALASVARDAWETAAEGDERAELVVAGDAQVYGDRGRMRQALENLFRNAREHGTPGAAEAAVDGCEDVPTDGDEEAPASGDDALTVLVTATDEGFLVADDGAGIDPEDRGSVFESGFTTRADGTGYGLDIVREIVESHGWTVELRCEADGPVGLPDGRRLRIPEGACFEVCAPDPADTDPEEPWIDR
jgi:signal transduction histidine kinase